jgi:hypothetical protein
MRRMASGPPPAQLATHAKLYEDESIPKSAVTREAVTDHVWLAMGATICKA